MARATVPLIRTSERQDFKRCRWRWDRRYNDGLESTRTGPALLFGDWMHQALAAYYPHGRKRGPHPAKTFIKLYDAYLEEHPKVLIRSDDERYDAGDVGPDMLNRYVTEWQADDDNIKIVLPEMPFAVKMVDIGGQPFYYVGRMDALAIDLLTDLFFILEHKTGSEDKKQGLQLDEQAGSYYAVVPLFLEAKRKAGIIRGMKNVDVDYILYNFLRKALADPRPQNELGQYLNKDGTVSKRQPPKSFERIQVFRDEHDRKEVLRRIRQEAFEMRMVRAGKLPVYKNPISERCHWDCQFYDACELHETGSDWRGFVAQTMVESDSYEEYRHDLRKEVKL